MDIKEVKAFQVRSLKLFTRKSEAMAHEYTTDLRELLNNEGCIVTTPERESLIGNIHSARKELLVILKGWEEADKLALTECRNLDNE